MGPERACLLGSSKLINLTLVDLEYLFRVEEGRQPETSEAVKKVK